MSTNDTSDPVKTFDPEVRVVDLSSPEAVDSLLNDPQTPSQNLERILYDGPTLCEYVVVGVDDVDQRGARIIGGCSWQDLRDQPASRLPSPEGPVFNVWEVVRAANQPLYLSSRYMGILYRAVGGREVLTNAVDLALFGLNELIAACAAPPPPPPACPTFTPISGQGRAWSNYKTSRQAAINEAKGLVPSRAKTDAGLELNGTDCPNPACKKKTLVGLTSGLVGKPVSSFSLIASFFYLEWRYIAYADYSWAAAVRCSK
ncbi:MAG: hypothetical protein AAF495_01005 [Pseudomonadota bacterium]